jgi:polar amino acid transport system substrate-binding protein
MQLKTRALTAALFLLVAPARADDVMQRVQARGALVVATAPAPEQLPESARTKEGGYSGFDVDVANEIGKRLGVAVQFVSPGWYEVLQGNWRGRWDLAVASITPTNEREEKLAFPAVYRFDAGALVVRKDNTAIERPADASGKTIGVRQGTTFENYLRRDLVIYNNPNAITYLIENPKIQLFKERDAAVTALVGRKVDAIVTSLGLAEEDIKSGAPLRVVQGFLFFEPVAVAVEKGDPQFAQKVGDAVRGMRKDGTLTGLSEKWFGIDVAGIVP